MPVPAVRPVAHMVGYAHLDPVWLWRWTEGYAEARATLRSAVDRMGEFPEFIYTFTSVVFLEWVKESDPGLFAEIGWRVAEGRFHLAGGWWVEADCNLPSGESLVRQGLYGQRFLAEHFGVVATVGGNPDSFGHAATLPQLLAGCGLSGYFFQRPERHEAVLPAQAFSWRGPDGTEIVACRIPRYCSDPYEIQGHVRDCLARSEPVPELLLFYGVGNHGGGPTRRNLDSLRRIHATSGAVDLLCSTPRSYLDAVCAAGRLLPTHAGELQHHARGCYSAHAGIKALNRRAESALADAERWASLAHALGGLPYPAEDLGRAWRQLLLNQFHDTLAGTAIESAYDDARNQLGETLAIAQRVTNAALGRLSRRVRIPAEGDMEPLVVFNPHPWPVRSVVEHDVGGWAKRMNLVDDAGHPVPLQWGRPEATVAEGRYRAVFEAVLPPLGYRLYRLRLGSCGVAPMPAQAPNTLENERLLAEVHPVTGRLVRLLHKDSGVDLVAAKRPATRPGVGQGPHAPEEPGVGAPGGAAKPPESTGSHAVVLVDEADTWGHGRDRWDEEAGAFVVVRVERVEHGPVRTVLRVTSRYRDSTLVEEYRLGAADSYLDVAVTLDWQERRRMLKLRYPSILTEPSVTAEVAYGTVSRAVDGSEESMHRFVDITGTIGGRSAGLAVANDGKYAYDVRTGPEGAVDLGLTVARSAAYAHHDPAALAAASDHRFLDLGEQRFVLRLVPHAGDWRAADVRRRAAELNQRPVCVRDTYHDGDLPGSGSFASLEGRAEMVLKRAEAGQAAIVRLAETDGAGGPVTVRLSFANRVLEALLGPHRVATFRIPDDPAAAIVPVDLCEWTDTERPAGQPTPDGRPFLPADATGNA